MTLKPAIKLFLQFHHATSYFGEWTREDKTRESGGKFTNQFW